MRILERTNGIVALSIFAALPMACGGGGGGGNITGNPPPTTQPPPVTTVIAEGSYSGLMSRNLLPVVFSSAQMGTLAATVDWTFATNNVEAYLVQGSNPCTVAQFNAGTCSFVAVATSATAKPERLSAGGQPPGAYTLYIGNRGTRTESLSWQVTLTTGGSASGSAVPPDRSPSPFLELLEPVSD